jgi:hypothetical protein
MGASNASLAAMGASNASLAAMGALGNAMDYRIQLN